MEQERSVVVEVRIPRYAGWEQDDLNIIDTERQCKPNIEFEPEIMVEEVVNPTVVRLRIPTNRFFAALLDLVQKDHTVYFVVGSPEVQDNLTVRRKVVARYDDQPTPGIEE